MPIYEYQCTQCGDIKEVLQKISDSPLKICQECSGPLQKLVSQSSFHLKGSGWYITDYAKSGSASQNKSSEAAAVSDTNKSDKTSEKTL